MRVSHRRDPAAWRRAAQRRLWPEPGRATHDRGVAEMLRQEFGVGIGGRCHGGIFERMRLIQWMMEGRVCRPVLRTPKSRLDVASTEGLAHVVYLHYM